MADDSSKKMDVGCHCSEKRRKLIDLINGVLEPLVPEVGRRNKDFYIDPLPPEKLYVLT